ncbi:MAG TPA: CDP-alcohol phosphatidyltransferase family protein [Reyranella sp.]|jgi:phosphatidylglycerophosphate synthase|nr:CDP-alcohol phosphatidyltransferase family protein [Reyranella sp.]
MFDPLLRRLIDPPLEPPGRWLARAGFSANQVSAIGLAIGLLAVPLLAYEQYAAALVVILINRLFDGLDGVVARQGSATAFGGYVDIVCDMVFYAAVPVGFALARPQNALWASVLLASFICTSSSFLGRAIVAAQRGEADPGERGAKSFFHSAGLMEGTETIAAFILFCLLPDRFALLAGIVAVLCFWTAAARILTCVKSTH